MLWQEGKRKKNIHIFVQLPAIGGVPEAETAPCTLGHQAVYEVETRGMEGCVGKFCMEAMEQQKRKAGEWEQGNGVAFRNNKSTAGRRKDFLETGRNSDPLSAQHFIQKNWMSSGSALAVIST